MKPTIDEAWDTFCRIVEAEKALPVEQRVRAALAEIIAPRNELLRRRAETIAAPIAARHGLSVAAVFARSKARHITPARDALCAELLDQAWSPTDVARALGVTRRSVRDGAVRDRARTTAAEAQERSRAHGA